MSNDDGAYADLGAASQQPPVPTEQQQRQSATYPGISSEDPTLLLQQYAGPVEAMQPSLTDQLKRRRRPADDALFTPFGVNARMDV